MKWHTCVVTGEHPTLWYIAVRSIFHKLWGPTFSVLPILPHHQESISLLHKIIVFRISACLTAYVHIQSGTIEAELPADAVLLFIDIAWHAASYAAG